ncbi:hypothetical protein RSOL_052510, partial [Rhizoctonia solani AG-3 Rhs1AP]
MDISTPSSPSKRRRTLASTSAGPNSSQTNIPPGKIWSSKADAWVDNLAKLWGDFCRSPPNSSVPPETVMDGLIQIRNTVREVLVSIDRSILQHIEMNPGMEARVPRRDAQMGTSPDHPVPEPSQPPPITPSPLSQLKTYAQAVAPRATRRVRARPKPSPSTATPCHVDKPIRIIASAPKAKGSSAKLLGVQWNKKGNLILTFPGGTSRTSAKTLFPTIIGSETRFDFRFDVPGHGFILPTF